MANYQVLGSVAVTDDGGNHLDIGGAQRRAVLAQLVLATGRTVSNEALCIGLWGDDTPATATKSIQIHVSRLRQVLPQGHIVTRPPGYALDVDPDATDVGRFERRTAAGRRLLAEGRAERAADELRDALALWRGPALADVADHPFAAGAIARLEEARRTALEDRIEADLAVGRHATVVAELEELVRLDPLRERLWGQLMVALYRCRRQADSLAAFGRARRHLVDELGIEPGPELRAIERAVLAQDLPAPAATPAAQPVTSPLRQHGPFVGRRSALASLVDALDRARSGRLTVVGVRGAEGLGKTALLATFASSAASSAGTIVAGRCREHVALPFGPWLDVLRQLGADTEIDLLEGPAESVGDEPQRRLARLFSGVVERLRAAASTDPLVLVVDDLHWSDAATVALLLHVAGELATSPILVVGAWRDREIGVGHPVTGLIHHLALTHSTEIALGPLDVDEIAELVRVSGAVDDTTTVESAARAIHEVTGGIALFAVDAVTTMRDTGDVEPTSVPATARTLVGRRLALAGDVAPTVAEACAVLGEHLDAREVRDLLPATEIDEIVDALDRLTAVGLLREEDAGHSFDHAVFRDTVLSATPSGRRATLHAAAYRSRLAAGAAPAVVAHHAERAEPLVASEEVVAQLAAAAADASARGAFLDAAAFHDRIATRSRGAERARALVAHADAMRHAGDIDAAKRVCAQVIADPGLDVPDDVLAEAVVLHTRFGGGFALDPASLECVRDALSRVTDPTAAARVRVAAAYHHAAWGSSTDVALRVAEDARATLPASSPPVLVGEALHAESLALLGSADLDRRRAIADEIVELGRRTGSNRDLGNGLRARVLVQMSAADLVGMSSTLDELLTVAERTGSWLYRTDVWRWRIAVEIARGDAGAAMAGIDELERLGSSPWAGRAFVVAQRAILRWAAGDLDGSLQLIDHLVASLPEDPSISPDRRLIDLCRLAVLADAGREQEAIDGFTSWAPHRTLDDVSCRHHTADLALVGRLACVAGDRDAARAVQERLEPFRGQLMVMSWGEGILGAAERHLAELDTLLSGTVDANAFERARSLEAHAGLSVEVARTDAARARAERLADRVRP